MLISDVPKVYVNRLCVHYEHGLRAAMFVATAQLLFMLVMLRSKGWQAGWKIFSVGVACCMSAAAEVDSTPGSYSHVAVMLLVVPWVAILVATWVAGVAEALRQQHAVGKKVTDGFSWFQTAEFLSRSQQLRKLHFTGTLIQNSNEAFDHVMDLKLDVDGRVSGTGRATESRAAPRNYTVYGWWRPDTASKTGEGTGVGTQSSSHGNGSDSTAVEVDRIAFYTQFEHSVGNSDGGEEFLDTVAEQMCFHWRGELATTASTGSKATRCCEG